MKRDEYLRDYPHERSRPKTQTKVEEVPKVNFSALRNQYISTEILARGQELKKKGRAKQNSTYPWKYIVSGDPHNDEGVTAYGVDLSDLSCSCRWFEITGSTCKHLVAALLDYASGMELG